MKKSKQATFFEIFLKFKFLRIASIGIEYSIPKNPHFPFFGACGFLLVGKFPKPLRAIYTQYKKAKDKEKFLWGNEGCIIIHEATAKTLQAAKNGGKLPDFKTLHTEYKELTGKKDKLYQEYGKLKKKVKQYDTIKQNVDSILRQAKQPERVRQMIVAKNKAKGD